jgi:hypothetical protein
MSCCFPLLSTVIETHDAANKIFVGWNCFSSVLSIYSGGWHHNQLALIVSLGHKS